VVGRIRISIGLIVLLASAVASARPASKGPYAEASLGASSFIGEAADYSKVGFAFDLRAGYDLFSWFSVGFDLGASTHEATVPPPPEGEYYQIYHANAEGRLSIKIRMFEVFANGGAGVGMISTNILDKVAVTDPGEKFSLVFSGGGGLEYQLQNRHYAFGVAGQWMMMPQFDAVQSVTGRAYLRYTY
jgi:hypothetical protein